MAKSTILTTLGRTVHKVGFQLRKHSPEILTAVGVVGTVASAVIACKATTKLGEVLEEGRQEEEKISTYVEEHGYSEEYTETDHKKDLVIVKSANVVNVAKLYAPAVILGVASLGCIITSHRISYKRNAALAAAYAAVDKSFKEYRGRVVERFGEKLDQELKYNLKTEEIEKTVVDENGKETVVKETVVTGEPSMYAKFFDEYCDQWVKDAEMNRYKVQQIQNWCNEKLKARGYLRLNEVYEMFGMEKSKAGQRAGWVYDPKNPDLENYITFGIFDVQDRNKRDFVNGRERSVLLDFNVDGDVMEIMNWSKY